jgi:cell division transport system permease protein
MTELTARLSPLYHKLRSRFAERFGLNDPDAPAPIVPEGNLAGSALMFVIAIMTFLASLTIGAVSIVRDTASTWQSQISREATIQIRPAPDLDMDAALETARGIASAFPGVNDSRIVSPDDTKRLLEPWLGTDFDMESLPVPRLVIVTINPSAPPDFAKLRADVTAQIPGAAVDDHRNWVDRLVKMARTMVFLGVGVLGLVLAATSLAVVFATRGAMSGNGHIIEVLHFVGAEAKFIARQFRNRFLVNGMKGALAGGLAAILVFFLVSVWSSFNLATPEGNQANALFGTFSIGKDGYLGVIAIIALVALITAETTRLTVIGYLHRMDPSSGMHA